MDIGNWKMISRGEAERIAKKSAASIPVILIRPNGTLITGWVMEWAEGAGFEMNKEAEKSKVSVHGLLRIGYREVSGRYYFEAVDDCNDVKIYIEK
ncbi:MAG: hypothetical protein J6J60_09665 [Clostridia bacterium]|nr:hypothetical protein [Clostridia bacterium]